MTTRVKLGMVEDGFASTAQLAALRSIFVGAIQDFPFVPIDQPWWLPCYGQTLARASYPALSAKFGGGGTTFVLPDYRGRVRAGHDAMGGVSANRLTGLLGGVNGDVLGATGGAETHALSEAQLPAHSHGITDEGHTHIQSTAPKAVADSDRGASSSAFSLDLAEAPPTEPAVTGITINNTGGNQAHNNVQPTAIVVTCILAY